MNLNGVEYYYIRNGQGDIIGLIDSRGTKVVSYIYDSWGKLVSIRDEKGIDVTNNKEHVGYKNPYRYRGYRFDSETGLYYLNSRYYNPEWGRYLNADALGGSRGDLLSHNVFAYCKNNPVNNTDPSGYSLISILSKINQYVFAVALVIVAVVNYNISGQNKSISNTINNAISNYKARNKAVSKSKSKVKDIATTNTKNQNPTYLRAKATHPGANVYVDQPLNLQSAKMILDIGGDVYAHSAADAEILSKSVGGGFTGPTNDGNPLNAMHYHPISYAARGHVFYGDDPNLNFVTLFK